MVLRTRIGIDSKIIGISLGFLAAIEHFSGMVVAQEPRLVFSIGDIEEEWRQSSQKLGRRVVLNEQMQCANF